MRARRSLPLRRPHQHFAIPAALPALKLIQWHAEKITDLLINEKLLEIPIRGRNAAPQRVPPTFPLSHFPTRLLPQPLPCLSHPPHRLFRRCRGRCQVPHLPPHARFPFPVQMQLHRRIIQGGCPIRFARFPKVPQQIRHRRRLSQFRRSQRQSAHRAHLLLELAGHRTRRSSDARNYASAAQAHSPAIAHRASQTSPPSATPPHRASPGFPLRAPPLLSRALGQSLPARMSRRGCDSHACFQTPETHETRPSTSARATTETSFSKSTNAS